MSILAGVRLAEQGLCVTGDTLLPVIREGKTKQIQIKEAIAGDLVYSLNEKTKSIEPHRINALLDMGVKPVFRLTTASGRSIRTTANHPYLVQRNSMPGEWVKVSELRVGESIACPSYTIRSVSFGRDYENRSSRAKRRLLQSRQLTFPSEFSFSRVEPYTQEQEYHTRGPQSNFTDNIESAEKIAGDSYSKNSLTQISQGFRNVLSLVVIKWFHIGRQNTNLLNKSQSLFDISLIKPAYASEIASPILWDTIVSIEPMGREQVYDIEVEGTHNFIGNGIFAHSTYTAVATQAGGRLASLSSANVSDLLPPKSLIGDSGHAVKERFDPSGCIGIVTLRVITIYWVWLIY